MSALDPVLDLVAAYRAGEAAYDARTSGCRTPADEDALDLDAIASDTYAGPLEALAATPPAATAEGAAAALQLALDLGGTSEDEAGALIRSALAFLEGGDAAACPVAALARQATRAATIGDAADATFPRTPEAELAQEAASDAIEAIETAAAHLPACSAAGAMFQAAIAFNEAQAGPMADPEAEPARTKKVLRALASVVGWIEAAHGLRREAVLGSHYCRRDFDAFAAQAAFGAGAGEGGAS